MGGAEPAGEVAGRREYFRRGSFAANRLPVYARCAPFCFCYCRLEFDPTLDELRKTKELRDGLSVMVQIGETLWVTNDETVSLERLTRRPGRGKTAQCFADHTRFPLSD